MREKWEEGRRKGEWWRERREKCEGGGGKWRVNVEEGAGRRKDEGREGVRGRWGKEGKGERREEKKGRGRWGREEWRENWEEGGEKVKEEKG
jgi:hypothetical protein